MAYKPKEQQQQQQYLEKTNDLRFLLHWYLQQHKIFCVTTIFIIVFVIYYGSKKMSKEVPAVHKWILTLSIELPPWSACATSRRPPQDLTKKCRVAN